MKRFHVHVSVDDLEANVKFYSTVFGAPPTVVKSDYAKWMVDDPRINFAISKRGSAHGNRSSWRSGGIGPRTGRLAGASGWRGNRRARSTRLGVLLCALR